MALEIVEAVEESLNEAFPPKPGGLVDKFRRKAAEERAREDEETNTAERIEQPSYKAVKVATQQPEVFAPSVITIAAGGAQMILPLSKYRARASIILSTAASTVFLCKDQGAAVSANGFPLPSGVVFPAGARGQLWGFNPGGAAIQVCVLAELYAPE